MMCSWIIHRVTSAICYPWLPSCNKGAASQRWASLCWQRSVKPWEGKGLMEVTKDVLCWRWDGKVKALEQGQCIWAHGWKYGALGTLELNPVLLPCLEVGWLVEESQTCLSPSWSGLPRLPTSQPVQSVTKKVVQSISVN